jgi:4-hydroxybenzoate polyprenyltransferase
MKTAIQQNEFSKPYENNSSFLKRFYLYQKERFPFLGHGLLVASFSFSAISYSRICRGAEGFVNPKTFLTGIFITISLFLLVRIFDEFKDAEDDALYRGELPVPRGLISLRELACIGIAIVILQIFINLFFFPQMLIIYFIVIAYLLLMGKEFFVSRWLKKHQFWYVTSHMFIIPLIDMYASGLDWKVEGTPPPKGLLFFFAVSYMNGIVLEIGRKIRIPKREAEGVLTYSSLLGANKATLLWIFILFLTLALSIAASVFAGYGMVSFIVLGCVFLLCSLPAFIFLKKKTQKVSKSIEYASAFWTIAMYMTLGGGPMISKIFFN